MTSTALLMTLRQRCAVTRPKSKPDGTVTYTDIASNVRCLVSLDDWLDAQQLTVATQLKRVGVCMLPGSMASVILPGDYINVAKLGRFTVTGKLRTVLDSMGNIHHVEAMVFQT